MAKDPYASLKHGLVGAWIPSISGSGLLLPDLSGRGNNGVIVGADSTFYVGTAKGIAISSDGTNDAFSCLPIRSGVNQVCLSTWIKVDTYNNTDDLLVEHTANYNLNNGFISDPCAGNGRWAVAISNAATLPGFTSYNYWDFARPSAGVWNHVLTYFDRTQGLNASGLRTWVNGVEQTLANSFTVGSMSGNFDATTTFFLSRAVSSLFLQAQIADIRLYDRLPTIPEIQLLASEPGIGFKRRASSTFAKRYTYQPPKAKVFEGVRVREHDYASLRQGLVGAWCPSLPNGGSGNILPDQSGRGNNGTLVGMGPEDWVASDGGRALDFDGSNDYVEVPFKFNSTGVISFWYRGATEPGTAVYLGDKSSTGTEIYLGQNITSSLSNELITFSNDVGANNRLYGYTTATRTELFDGAWHHVAVVLRQVNTAPEIYLDGNSKAVTPGNSGLGTWSIGSASGTTLQFGAQNFSNTNSVFLTGQLDDIRLYSRALTEAEIKLLASKRGIGLQPSPTRFIAKEKKTGLRRLLLTGQT